MRKVFLSIVLIANILSASKGFGRSAMTDNAVENLLTYDVISGNSGVSTGNYLAQLAMRHIDGKSLSPQTFSLLGEQFVRLAETRPEVQEVMNPILEAVSSNETGFSARISKMKKPKSAVTPSVADENLEDGKTLPKPFSSASKAEIRDYGTENLDSVYRKAALDLGIEDWLIRFNTPLKDAGIALETSRNYTQTEINTLSSQLRKAFFIEIPNAISNSPFSEETWGAQNTPYVRVLNKMWNDLKLEYPGHFTNTFEDTFRGLYAEGYVGYFKTYTFNLHGASLVWLKKDYESWKERAKSFADAFYTPPSYKTDNENALYTAIARDLGVDIEKVKGLNFAGAGILIDTTKPYDADDLKNLAKRARAGLLRETSKVSSSPFPPFNMKWADQCAYVRLLNDIWATAKNADFTDAFKTRFETNNISDWIKALRAKALNRGADYLILKVEDYNSFVDQLRLVARAGAAPKPAPKAEEPPKGAKPAGAPPAGKGYAEWYINVRGYIYYKRDIEKNMDIMEFENYSYAVFANLTSRDLLLQYRKKAMEYHEDKLRTKLNKNEISQAEFDRLKPLYTEKFKAMSSAYEYLKDIKEKM